jgi:hypothetical protein
MDSVCMISHWTELKYISEYLLEVLNSGDVRIT